MNGIKEAILNRDNKKMGITMVLISLMMLFSLTLFPYNINPLYLLEIGLMTVFGFGGLLALLLIILMSSLYYYLEVEIEWFSKKRLLFIPTLIFAIFMLISLIKNSMTNDYYNGFEVVGFIDFYIKTTWDQFHKIAFEKSWTESNYAISFQGFILPALLWLIGGFTFYGLILYIPVILLILYSLYVLMVNEYVLLFSKLMFWNNDDIKIDVQQKTFGIDLNQSTEEFELKLGVNHVTEEQLEFVEKVRKNLKMKNYEDLSEQISKEKSKLEELRNKIVSKASKQKEEQLKESRISDSQRTEILMSLGYSSYSSIKASQQRKEAVVASKMPFTYKKPETYIEENEAEENIELMHEGYKTTEAVYKVEEPVLADSFVEDMLEGFDPTMETPLLDDYLEIFENEDELVEEVVKTLETVLDIPEEVEVTTEEEVKEVTGEIIIDNLSHEVTMEEYLSIPEVIAHSHEEIDHSTVPHLATDEMNIHTEKSDEFSSIDISEESEEAIKVIEETPSAQEEGLLDSLLQSNTSEEMINESQVEGKWCDQYIMPPMSLLNNASSNVDTSVLIQEANAKSAILNSTFLSFGVKASVHSFEIGPTITTFKISLEPGIKTTKVTGLEDNIKLSLGAEFVRILAPLPGTIYIGIEVPNSTKQPVSFKNVFEETNTVATEGINISIGKGVSGNSISFDLAKAPHLLVAGSTGSGKSVSINTILASILLRYKPTDVQLVLVDPKMVEFAPFHGIPHLLSEVITDANDANNVLHSMVEEMEDRYRLMASMGAKKIEELNVKLLAEGKDKLPYIVIVIDELADLMMVAAKEVEESIMRITQKARAAGIHMILATQRPSTEVITGTIKSNIPSRIAFTVASSIDSRTILGQIGAEKLIGMGDMLVSLYGQLPFRGQGAYISNDEIDSISDFTKTQCSPSYKIDIKKLLDVNEEMLNSDPLIEKAKAVVLEANEASTSLIKRRLGVGYDRALNILDELNDQGVISKSLVTNKWEVL